MFTPYDFLFMASEAGYDVEFDIDRLCTLVFYNHNKFKIFNPITNCDQLNELVSKFKIQIDIKDHKFIASIGDTSVTSEDRTEAILRSILVYCNQDEYENEFQLFHLNWEYHD